MSLSRIAAIKTEIDDLQSRHDGAQENMDEMGEELAGEQKNQVLAVLSGWKDKIQALHLEATGLIPAAADEATTLLSEQVVVKEGKDDAIAALLKQNGKFFSDALGDDGILSYNYDLGESEEDAERAMEISEAISRISELEATFPALGKHVVATLAGLTHLNPASERALSVIASAESFGLTLQTDGRADVASDLFELSLVKPAQVKAFLRSLEPDALLDVFEGGLPQENTTSLHLMDINQAAALIDQQFVLDQNGTGQVNALSTIALLVHEAEEAIQGNDPDSFAKMLGILSALGMKRVQSIAAFDYQKGQGRSGDVHYAAAHRDGVLEFLELYAQEIAAMNLEFKELKRNKKPEAASTSAAVTAEAAVDAHFEAAKLAVKKMAADSRVIFQDVDLEAL